MMKFNNEKIQKVRKIIIGIVESGSIRLKRNQQVDLGPGLSKDMLYSWLKYGVLGLKNIFDREIKKQEDS
jgi:hypothetical protein